MNLPPKKYCPYCRAQLGQDVKFCESCGKPVDTRVQPTVPIDQLIAWGQPQPPPLPLPPPPRLASYNPPPAGYYPPAPAPQAKRGLSWVSILLIILAVVGLACLVLVGGGAVLISQNIIPNPLASVMTKATQAPLAVLPTQESLLTATEGVPPAVETQPTSTQPPSPSATATQAAPTIEPTATSAAPATLATPTPSMIEFAGALFDPGKLGNADAVFLDASSGADKAPWELYPAHVEFTFTEYPLQGSIEEAMIYVWPVDDFRQVSPQASKVIDALQATLKKHPTMASSDGLPFLPLIQAGQLYQMQIRYMDFQNGSGVRFITEYAQGAYPASNEMLLYTFQGLTSDNQWYFAVTFPVSYPNLTDPATYLNDASFSDHFDAYKADLEKQFDALKPADFVPNLDWLDAVVKSMQHK